MGKKQVTRYVSFPVFTQEEVKEINKKIINLSIKDPEDPQIFVDKVGKFSRIPCRELVGLIQPWLDQCQQANREVFKYDVFWNFDIDWLNYNVYGQGGLYDWHIDAAQEGAPIDVKLTCLLNLSEESYDGGEFGLIHYKEPIEFTSGMGILFTSLIAHKVTPITTGERRTLTYWANGPEWI